MKNYIFYLAFVFPLFGISFTSYSMDSQLDLDSFSVDIHYLILTNINDNESFANLTMTSNFWNYMGKAFLEKTLIIGCQGAGKSTLIHLLAKEQLIAKYDDDCGDWSLDGINRIPNIIIGHGFRTETRKISPVIKNNRMLVEYPDFYGYTYGARSQNTASALQKVLKEKTKLILVLSEITFDSSLYEGAEEFVSLMNDLARMFKNQDRLEKAMAIVISKHEWIPTTEGFRAICDIRFWSSLFSEDARALLNSIIDANRVVFFDKPQEIGPYKVSKELDTLIENVDFNKIEKMIKAPCTLCCHDSDQSIMFNLKCCKQIICIGCSDISINQGYQFHIENSTYYGQEYHRCPFCRKDISKEEYKEALIKARNRNKK